MFGWHYFIERYFTYKFRAIRERGKKLGNLDHLVFELCTNILGVDADGVNQLPIFEGDVLEWKYLKSDPFRATVVFGFHRLGYNSYDRELTTMGFFLQFSDGSTCGFDKDVKYKILGSLRENSSLGHKLS
jgi:hypothetical protein